MPDFNRGAKVVAGLVVGGTAILGGMNQWEGDVHTVYADKLAGGIPTVCEGHTDWKLKVGDQLSTEDCQNINVKTATDYGLAILKCAGHTEANRVFRNQHEFDAHTLRAINIGVQGECGSRSMKLLKQGLHDEACEALANGPDGTPVWSYVDGGAIFVRGLYNRRLFERAWCLEPMESPQPTMTAKA